MNIQSPIAITLSHVTKEYTIHHEHQTLVRKIIHKDEHEERFIALHDITMSIRKGERIGIVGANGSGKTTLLKIIAGITAPTTGIVTSSERVVSLIDVEAGFHPDLTGEQNIYLNGLILGMTKAEIDAELEAIIRFAAIGKFIDIPMFTYSDGMKLRLGFAIAIHAHADVIILDEHLSVGDEAFLKKVDAKVAQLVRKGKTIIVVSHWLPFLRETCNRILVMRHGKVVADGTIALLKKYKHNNI